MLPKLDDNERAIVEKYHFKVSVNDFGDYIVIDPELPKGKNRFKGANLVALMCRALDRRQESNVIHLPVREHNKVIGKLPTTKAKVIPVHHGKVHHGKIYEMKRMMYEDNNISAEKILSNLKELGLVSSLTVVITVKNDFLSTLRVLRELGILGC